jgi:glycosyltransferase involved in cell wall biosynthesis
LRILIAIGVLRQREAGAAGVVFNQAEELEKLGHSVDCWFFDDVLTPPRWPERFKDLEFSFAVSRRLREDPSRYNVVNLHAPWGCVYGLSRKWSRSAELPPYVFTMQGSEERFARAMKLEHRKGRAANFALKNRLWHRIYHQSMYDFSISTADYGAVANREGWILSELKYGHPPGRIWYIPNGVNEKFFQPREFTNAPTTRLLYVGSWIDRKGIYYLAEAFAALVTRAPEVQLTVAGCIVSEEQVKAYFPEGVGNRISVLPFLTRDAMPNLYASHDIFVFPSLVEGMPLTLLEAMAGAMPVVTANTCGMSDLIENGKNGLLVPAADARALGEAIDRLRNAPELRRNLGLRARESAKGYTWDLIARQLERVFQLAMKSRRVTGTS